MRVSKSIMPVPTVLPALSRSDDRVAAIEPTLGSARLRLDQRRTRLNRYPLEGELAPASRIGRLLDIHV